MKKLMLSVFALAAVVLSANAATSATGTGDATLVTQVSIATTGGAAGVVTDGLTGSFADGLLQFGTIALGTGDNTVTIAPTTGARVIAGAGTATGTTATTVSAAAFKVTGASGLGYTVTLPTSSTITDGTTTLTVNSYASSLAGNTASLTGGDSHFAIGGTLTLTGTMTTGHYTGSFPITVAYN